MIEEEDNGLPIYIHPSPPLGQVRELWHVAHPMNNHIPIPTGIVDMNHWGSTIIQMDKYKGKTFEEILDLIRLGNREVIQWASWIVHKYSPGISKTPKTQAPDMAAYLLRNGFDPDERRTEMFPMSELLRTQGGSVNGCGLWMEGLSTWIQCGISVCLHMDWMAANGICWELW